MIDNFYLRVLNRLNPNLIWYLYAKKCQKIFDKSYFILSFDCDTVDDIEVVWDVHSQLQDLGITPVYAVPGELLKKGATVYSKIHSTGAEFINHGGREHTYFDIKHARHESCFFYDQQSHGILKEDIVSGHEILKGVLGITAKGWRTPHFGTFQKPEHLTFLYNILSELGYLFSTSTSPSMAYKNGPIYKRQGIIEMPVTGIFSEPLNILDSWGYFAAPGRTRESQDYMRESKKMSSLAADKSLLLNIYADPSHIHDQPAFFSAIKLLADVARNINYKQLLEISHENLRTLR
jgi:hypothetical protein